MITGTCKHMMFIVATVLNALMDHKKDRNHVQHTASGDWKHELARGKHEHCECVLMPNSW